MLMDDVQCLYSVAIEVIPGNAVRMCEFPWQHKAAPVCCGLVDNEHSCVCVCTELILEETTNALSHKMIVPSLSCQGSHQKTISRYTRGVCGD